MDLELKKKRWYYEKKGRKIAIILFFECIINKCFLVQHPERVPAAEETPEIKLSSKIKDFTAISNSPRILT